MKTNSQFFRGFVLLLFLILLSTADAQQKGRGRGGFGAFSSGMLNVTNLVSIAGNDAVQKELMAGEELKEKLSSLREDLNAARQKEYQLAGINPRELQNLTAEQRQKMTQISTKLTEEFDPKLKAIVSADQLKRLQQIRLQSALQFQGPPALLNSDVASEINLSDEQRRKLNALTMEYAQKQRELFSNGSDPAATGKMREERAAKVKEVLTEEQKEKLKSLQGSPFDVSQLFGGFGGRGKGN